MWVTWVSGAITIAILILIPLTQKATRLEKTHRKIMKDHEEER